MIPSNPPNKTFKRYVNPLRGTRKHFRRICKDCERLFRPTGKTVRFCKKCLRERLKTRWTKGRYPDGQTHLERMINKLEDEQKRQN